MNLEKTTLPNGVRVASARMPAVESVAIGVWVGVGGRYEKPRVSGVSHFIEHLLFKGTQSLSAREISQAIEGRGGYFNAFTQEEATCYYARVAAAHARPVLEILADMYLHPRFARTDIDKERGVILEEIMMYRDQPQHVVGEMLGKALWAEHPLGTPLIGTEEIISTISRQDILDYKAGNYVPANTIVVFAGKVDHAECVDRAATSFGGLKKKQAPQCRKVDGRIGQVPIQTNFKEIEQTHFAMGFRHFGRHDRRKYIVRLLSILLGGNMSSRLFQIVRERHGLAYSIHCSVELFEETGALVIQAGVDRKKPGQALTLILNELARICEKSVGKSELRRAKDYALGQLQIGLESTSNQMMWAGENLLSYGHFIQPEEVMREIEAIQPADIQAVARDIIRPQHLSVAMVAPAHSEFRDEHVAAIVKKAW